MKKQSAGLLVYKREADEALVLLAHPGGPFWAKRDIWSIPKGELDPNEDQLEAARREFQEEIGEPAPTGQLIDLGTSLQTNKINHIWAVEGEVDFKGFVSNRCEMEWPPKSGKLQEFPENDKASWFTLTQAKQRLYPAQAIFIDRLAEHLDMAKVDVPSQQSLL